jgi:hypothetical protein
LRKRLRLNISPGRTNAIADGLKKREAKNKISAKQLKKVEAKDKISDEQMKKLGVHVRNVRALVSDPNSVHTSDTEYCSEDEIGGEDDEEDDTSEDESTEEGGERRGVKGRGLVAFDFSQFRSLFLLCWF